MSLLSTEQCVLVSQLRDFPSFESDLASRSSSTSPSVLVPLMVPSLRMKGLHLGRWSLLPSSPPSLPPKKGPKQVQVQERQEPDIVHLTHLLDPGAPSYKYEFDMTLMLLSSLRGRSVPPFSLLPFPFLPHSSLKRRAS